MVVRVIGDITDTAAVVISGGDVDAAQIRGNANTVYQWLRMLSLMLLIQRMRL